MSALDEAFVTPEHKRRYVRRLFATIAPRYDLITRVLSGGLDQRWKRRLIGFAAIAPGARVLDLACGTGDLARLASAGGAEVVGLDITPAMIELDRRRGPVTSGAATRWVVGDMTSLPAATASFTAVTTGYGLRNVPDLPAAIAEIHRVLRPGGVFCSLDFDRPEQALVRGIYLAYLDAVGGALGWLLHGDPDTYRYIPASIRRYPGARGVAAMLAAAGFRDVRHVRVLGGFMAIHVAER